MQTEIVSDPKVPMVRITREFDAPPVKVFRAHTDPEILARWLGPTRSTLTVDYFDCRNGGSYRYVIGGEGAEKYGFRGCFHEVRPAEVIVQTFAFEGVEGVALEKLVFEDLGNGRTRLVATALVDSFEGRDAFVASGMEEGTVQGYEQLDAVLAEM
jgi:uncharacterized protein YndB with AHSA1/START domain